MGPSAVVFREARSSARPALAPPSSPPQPTSTAARSRPYLAEPRQAVPKGAVQAKFRQLQAGGTLPFPDLDTTPPTVP
jgi:hypothetical protein